MKIVVTGAIGHIGSYLIRDLAARFPGSEIVMIDNLMTQRFPSLFNLPTSAKYRFIDADLTTTDLNPMFKGANAVVHLAAITDAAGSVNNAALVESNNFIGTEKVAAACLENACSLITLSSTSVYGTQNSVVSEDCDESELQPQSPYALTKLKEERLIDLLCREQGLSGVSLRFGTIFGDSPGMRFHTAVNKFCWQAVMGLPITVWKTAYDQKRPYLDLRDASRAIGFFIKNNLFDGRIYNVLTQNATVREIVDCIKEFEPNLDISFVDNQIMNQLSYEVSSQRIQSKGFNFSGDLRLGIKSTIDLLKSANQKNV
jgi:UDP-glucose 4-epimerase